MWYFIITVAFFGIFIFLGMAAFSFFKKSGKTKKRGLYALISFVVFVIAFINIPVDKNKSENTQAVSTTPTEKEEKETKQNENNEKKSQDEKKIANEKALKEKARQKEKAEELAKQKKAEAEKESAKKKELNKTTVSRYIKKSIGKKTNTDHKRIVDLEVNDNMGTVEEGDKIIIAKLYGNENVTNDYTKKGMLMDSEKVFKTLFKHKEISDVAILWQFPLVDAYGKESLQTVLKVEIDRKIFDKIQWDNFDYRNFDQVAATYFVHPALQTK